MGSLRTCRFCAARESPGGRELEKGSWTCPKCHRVNLGAEGAPCGCAAFGIVVMLALGLWWLLTPPGLKPGRNDATCRSNLMRIGLALHNYHDDYGSFPPAYIADEDGRPMHSWRVLLLPYLDQAALYARYRFDEPWNGPNNSQLHGDVQHSYEFFFCPTDSRSSAGHTSYVAVVGAETAWPGVRPVSIREVRDGTSVTVVVVELHDSGIHWMEPRDLDFGMMSFKINDTDAPSIKSGHSREAKRFWQDAMPQVHVLMADGSVRRLPVSANPAIVRALLTMDGGEKLDEPWLP